jgi:polysaccharide export outer membrane protein
MSKTKKFILFICMALMTFGCEWDRNMNYGHRRRHLFFRTSRAMFSPIDTLNVSEQVISDLDAVRYTRPDLKYYTAKNWTAKMSHTPDVEKLALYTLEPGSTFSLDVEGELEISKTYVVGPDGNVSIALLEESIPLAGLSYGEAKDLIIERLEKYIKIPKVNTNAVLIKSKDSDVFKAGEAIMLGAYGGSDENRANFTDPRGGTNVKTGVKATIVNISGKSTFLRAIASVGGVSGDADMQNIVVLRELNNELHVIVVDFQRLTQFGDLTQNIDILKGDIIYVPLREHSFGEQFAYEWSTLLRYLGGLITWDFALEQFDIHGRLK